jgi:hypothetical protein
MGKTQSWDNAWDMDAMSQYNTITSIAESPVQESLIYVGTDDGLIQVTEDGGENWKKIELGSIKDIPETAFVNDIKADLYDASTVYVVLDNHKFGDLNPYLIKSTDKGTSWKSIKSDLPERTLLWRIVQDHENPELLFLATEFGIYFTLDCGGKWIKFKGGLPTISFRDLAIQKRENDLVAASFGRGFYILDDYSLLRNIDEETLKKEAELFPVKDSWWYIRRSGKGSQGSSYFRADNPPYGAVFTYYLKEGYPTLKSERKKEEKKKIKEGKDVIFPGWDAVESERREESPKIILTIKDDQGNVVRRIEGPASKGFHRVNWDLRYANTSAINIHDENPGGWDAGFMSLPGEYTVSMASLVNGKYSKLCDAVPFKVVRMKKGALKGASEDEMLAYMKELKVLREKISASEIRLENAEKKVKAMKIAAMRANNISDKLLEELDVLRNEILDLKEQFYGNKSKGEIGEGSDPTLRQRFGFASSGSGNSYGPTPLQRENLAICKRMLEKINSNLEAISQNKIPGIIGSLENAGAPIIFNAN